MNNIKEFRLKDNLVVEATFFSGEVKAFHVSSLFERHPEYRVLETDMALWNGAKLLPQGTGIYFNDDLDLTVEEIWRDGETVAHAPLEPKYVLAYSISAAREEKNLSQMELSRLSGVAQCDISRIEGGVANPTIETISRLCKVLGLSLRLYAECE